MSHCGLLEAFTLRRWQNLEDPGVTSHYFILRQIYRYNVTVAALQFHSSGEAEGYRIKSCPGSQWPPASAWTGKCSYTVISRLIRCKGRTATLPDKHPFKMGKLADLYDN